MNLDPKKTVFLIDGSSFLYRAYYSLRPLHTPQGAPVQAVYGFCRMVKKVLDTFSPSFIALVWDSKGKTTRHELFPAYKATRQAPPSDLFQQKEIIQEFADQIGLHQYAQPGVEADDLMYSLAQELTKQGYTIVFITSDKDMSQVLSDKVMIYDAFKDEFVTEESFEAKRRFPVEKLPFYFALLGDSSDNIPGVKGIGEKGATDLVQQFDSLNDLYQNLERVAKERTRLLLQEQKENAFLSEQLFLLRYIPTGLKLEDLAYDKHNWNKARPLFEQLNFKSLLKGVDEPAGAPTTAAATLETKIATIKKYSLKAITTEQELLDLCAQLKDKKLFAIDTETNGLRPLESELVGISLCYQEGQAFYIPLGHKTAEAQLTKEIVFAQLKSILEDAQYHKYMHSANFDQLVLYHAGITVRGVVFDTCIAANLVTKDWERVGLKELSKVLLLEEMLTYEEVVKNNKYKDFSYVPLELATLYAAFDAHQTWRLKKVLEEKLNKEQLQNLFAAIELPLVQVLVAMEVEGISIDRDRLAQIDALVTQKLQALEQGILDLIGEHNKAINLNSPKQLEELLFTQLQLPPQKKSAKRTGYSTDQEVLEFLATMHPVPALILKWRELAKLKNTYIDALPNYINPHTHRIHTTYNQVAVATGRLASSDPNLQNIPVDSFGFRSIFIPEPEHLFLSADYSQIELRVLAHVSGDLNLTAAFLSGADIHVQTAARLFDVPLDQVTNEQRQVGKRINFSILYGLTPYGLSKDLNISLKDAKIYIDKYFKQYPAVSTWMEQVVEQTKQRGYVTTLWGRRRYVPAIYEKNKVLYDEARRVAINTVAQGTAAEIMKQGMIALEDALQKHKLGAKMVLQIHDELLLTVPKAEQQQTEQLVKSVLETVVDWTVPLVVSTSFGANWYEVTK